MIIEVSGGVVTNILATEPVSIYLIDHDAIEAGDDPTELATAQQPDGLFAELEIVQIVNNHIEIYMEG